jgi:hypothetical protein
MRLVITVAAACLVVSAAAWGDVDSAKNYLKEAQALAAQKDVDGARKKLELAESELDDVSAADKAPIARSIADLRTSLTSQAAAADKPRYTSEINGILRMAEDAIGNPGPWSDAEGRFNDFVKDPDVKAAMGPDLDAALKKFASFKKLHQKKVAAAMSDKLETDIKALEEQWTKSKPALAKADTKDDAVEQMEEAISRARNDLKSLPADDEHVKAFTARVDKVAGEFTKIALADKVKAYLARIKEDFDSDKSEWDGYEKETAGPTWDVYRKQVSNEMDAFLAPKTEKFIERMDTHLHFLEDNDDYKEVQADPSIKAFVDGIHAKRDAAYKKLLKFATAVVDAADKATIDNTLPWNRLHDDVRVALGTESPESQALQERVAKKVHDFETAADAAEANRGKLAETLRTKANESWPGLSSGISAAADPDFSHPERLAGKTVRFSAHNLMGSRYNPGDFYFATTVGGIPVAGKIDPQLIKQIDATEKAIHRTLGADEDGPWEIIAVVSDSKAKLSARRQVEARGTIQGADVRLRGETADAVDAVVIQIIGAKCGPFCGVKDKGVLKVDGTVGK